MRIVACLELPAVESNTENAAAVTGSAPAVPDERREAPGRRELLESVFESTAVGFAVIRGLDCVFEMVNPAYQALSPYREMLGRPFEAVWPEAAERILPIFHRVIESDVPFETVDMRVDIQRSPGGPLEESYFSFACRRLPGHPGETPALLVRVLDTTPLVLARRQAEDSAQRRGVLLAAEHGAREQAERARERFEMLVRFIAEVNEGADFDAVVGTALRLGVSLLGADDGVLRLIEEGGSSACAFVEVRDCGRTGEAVSLDLLPHSREAAEAGQAVYVTAAEAQGGEAELFRRGSHSSSLILPLTRDGVCFGFMYLNWKARADRLPAQDVAFAKAMADQCALAITRAWILESEKAARAAAEGLSRHQEMLATILAHDLRNPISAIAATSTALIRRSGLDERQMDAVGRIAAIAKRMGVLVEDLLDFARVRQAGGLPVERERTDIEPICARVIQQLLDSRPGRQVSFALSGPGEGLWDPSRLEQVVSNLVGNALERAPAGAAVEVRAAGTADELVLTVRNEGPVIPGEMLATLFDAFRRGDKKGSIGLGLFIVSEIVRAHGGDISVTSDHADGTRFTVRLPRAGPKPG
jgi:signal transduction histidine kinase